MEILFKNKNMNLVINQEQDFKTDLGWQENAQELEDQTLEKIIKNPNKYAEIRSKAIADDMVDEEMLPEQYDQVYYCLGIAAKNHTPLDVYNINALLAVEFLDHLAGFVKPGGIVRIMSSITGSITSVLDNPMPAVHLHYKMSKAALNIGVATLHHKHKNVTWQLIHPGLVKTKMTAGVLDHVPGAIDPDTCADYLTALPHQHQTQLQFLNYDGNIIGW
jgi:hypothetical protein